MSQAPTYTRTTGFADDERANSGGRTAVRADRLDAELDAASQSINALRANQALIQRDDGTLRDQIVTPQALSPGAITMLGGSKFTPRGAWASGADYAAFDLVERGGASYVCPAGQGHTAGSSFSDDATAGRWQVFPGQPNAAAVPFTPTVDIPQTDVQAAIAQVEADARRMSLASLAINFGAF